jgi:hypothetical protein
MLANFEPQHMAGFGHNNPPGMFAITPEDVRVAHDSVVALGPFGRTAGFEWRRLSAYRSCFSKKQGQTFVLAKACMLVTTV